MTLNSFSSHPTPEEVREQLSILLQSKDFKASDRLKKFLEFVVEEKLVGNEGNIKAYTIAMNAFGRGKDFDPQLDPIVRIEAGKLRKALEIYFFSHPDHKLIIEIPKGTYVPVFRYVEASNGMTASQSQTACQDFSPASSSNFSPPVFPDVSPAVYPNIGEGAEKKQPNGEANKLKREERPILLILPFTVRGNDEDVASFLSSLADNLLVKIHYNEVVHVLEAPIQYLPNLNHLNIVQYSKQAGARFVLHGQAQVADKSIRLYIALTDAEKGLRIWTEKYDVIFNPNNFLDAQDQITQDIFSKVLDSFGIIARTLVQEANYMPFEERGVYEATLPYVEWVTSFDRESYLKAKQSLELNMGKDPHNPILLAQLSDIYSSDFQFAFNQVDNNLDLALDFAKKALAIDSNCHLARLAKALYYFLVRDKNQLEFILKALPEPGDVNPYVRASVGLFIGMAIDLAEGKKILEQAVLQNPYQPSCYNVVPFMYHFSTGDYDEALQYALQINAPSCVWNPIILTAAYGMLGQLAEAGKFKDRLFELEPNFKSKQKQLLYGLFFSDNWVAMIETGLKKAGV